MSKSSTITAEIDRSFKRLPPVHPGEILREEFLSPANLSAGAVARACGIPRTRIERLIREETSISADTALRLGRYFSTSADFWMNLQIRYDLEGASRSLGRSLDGIKPVTYEAAE